VSEPLRFGVLGPTSTVARLAVIPAILASPLTELQAVASLSAPEAEGGPEGTARRYFRYEKLLADPEVDAVYIPLPNSLHREWTVKAAAAGKHVLCEKPLAATAEDAVAMTEACAAAGVVLMEAYMTPFHPRSRAVVSKETLGRLGRPVFGSGIFTGSLTRADDHRWRPEMGGGALLDVGIYCLGPLLAAAATSRGAEGSAGDPDDVTIWRAWANRAPLGVDASFEASLDLGGDMAGLIRCSFEAVECQRLTLVGTEATLVVERAFTPSWGDSEFRLIAPDGSIERIETDSCDPYLAMVEHFAEVVAGRATLERTPADSIALARLLARLDQASRAEVRSPAPSADAP
jgi:xylose dehydrogenase (NAD/NADP)